MAAALLALSLVVSPSTTLAATPLVVSGFLTAEASAKAVSRTGATAQETIADIRVHGNLATTDQELVRLAGVEVGSPLGATTIADITSRLRATKRFEKVEVLKRYASIDDPTRIVLVIVVDEGPVRILRTGNKEDPTRVVRTHAPPLFLPVLRAEDGYGFTYGARFTWPDLMGKGSRLSFPGTWGGDKRAAAELEKDFTHGPLTRVSGGASLSQREHPFFEQDDTRRRVFARVERDATKYVHVGATAGWQHVSFLGATDTFAHVGADATIDTRLDPILARNAVYARAVWDRFDVAGGVSRRELDARGYVGLLGQSVLVVRALREDGSGPLPPYLKPMLGGMSNLRGFRAGTAVGDTLVAGSAELRLPLTSPLDISKLGISVFADAGTVYDHGQRFRDQRLKRGVGASVWVTAAFIHFSLSVAHGIGATTRVHFGGAVSF